MKTFITLTIVAIIASAALATVDEPAHPQTRITCDLIGGIFGNLACDLHCLADGYDYGICSQANQCACKRFKPKPAAEEVKEAEDQVTERLIQVQPFAMQKPQPRFTCNVIGGAVGKLLCNLHCVLHQKRGGICNENKICECYGTADPKMMINF